MRLLAVFTLALASFGQQLPTVVAAGIWPLCGTVGNPLAAMCQPFAPGTEPWMVMARATIATTVAYKYTITATREDGSEMTASGYFARIDTPDSERASIAVVALGRVHNIKITIIELQSAAFQFGAAK